MGKLFVTLLSYLGDLDHRLRSEDEGATAVEYGLMVALIAVVIAVAVGSVGQQLNTMFNTVLAAIS
jgi:pilus assembly protein Flp/PilA